MLIERVDKFSRERRAGFRWLLIPITALICAVALNLFVLICAFVPSASMENTIRAGSLIVAFRLAYLNHEPARGDVVLFRQEELGSSFIVKRIIGLPGEIFEIRDGSVYINGEQALLEEPYAVGEMTDDFGPLEIPAEHYIVLGDNRSASHDSRYWQNPFVERRQIKAKAEWILWPSPQKIR
ncbi:MAG: signal peptidase I [Clostridiales bacterium]|nr:signal peptidase I [Clostridiales bacterium]